MKIEDFASELNKLIEDRDFYKKQAEQYKLQLIVIGLMNNGELNNLNHPDLTKMDFSNINIGYSLSSITVINSNYNIIRKWEEIPLKKKEEII